MQEISIKTTPLKKDLEPIVLSQTKTTRVVLKGEKFPDSGLRLWLVHQKGSKHWGQDIWEDEKRFDKRTLTQEEFVDFELDTAQTIKLLEALPQLAALAEINLEYGYSKAMVLQGKERELLSRLMLENEENFWELVEELKPGRINNVAILKEHEKRKAVLETFKQNLEQQVWNEAEWQNFFDENQWIFGHGLDTGF